MKVVQNVQYLIINELLKRQPDVHISMIYNEDANEKENIHELFQILLDCIDNIEKNHLQPNKYSLVVNKAMKYLNNNYTNPDLSQKEVAESLNITTTYLSALFKKELNINFSDYLTIIRIEKACTILRDSGKKYRKWVTQ